ncbi:MAG: dipeptide epimerase [Sphingobacteriales bacterium]|nr:MAG: dipeptide epimerase [Sphingobacteriales bacterium]
MRLWYRTYELPFRHPFTISKGTKTQQPTLLVALEHLGHAGFGEAPAITYYDITTEKLASDLERKKLFVEKFAFTDPERYWHYLHHLYPANPFLVCALDIAGWDLFGKMKRKPLQEFWQPAQPLKPITDYTIGIDSIENMVAKMQERPWPLYKIKLGTEQDIAIVEALRRHTDVPFRIDANAAWTVDEAIEKITALAQLGVELVEQPLAKDDWEGMKRLMDISPLPLIADESCVFESDVEKCAGHFHGINIKLTKCSGITPALRMIKQARELGLKVMIGSMNETSVGSAAIAHLSCLADHIDADGPMLLSQDLATGLTYHPDGRVATSGEPGLGIQFNPEPYEK